MRDISCDLVTDDVCVHLFGSIIAQQIIDGRKLAVMLFVKVQRKQCFAADRNIGRIQLILLRCFIDLAQHIGQRSAERDNDDEILVFFLDLRKGKHCFSVKDLTAYKSVACIEVRSFDTILLEYGKDLVRAVSHAVQYDRLICRRKVLP